MSMSILVAYATRYGSTREVAEAVATTLRERGLAVDCEPMAAVRSLEGYRAVVLGAPFYMSRWHKDARSFVARHRHALIGLPAAVFALGPFHDNEKEFLDVRQQLDKALAGYPWLALTATAIFGGKFDPAALRFPYTLIPALKNLPASDIRDWTKIRAWADEVATTLHASPVEASALT